MRRSSTLILLSAFSLALLAGCPGRLQDPERFGAGGARDGGTARGDGSVSGDAGSDAIDVPAMLAAECAGSGCHGATSPAFGLDLVSPGVAERVLEATSSTCMNRPLVDPADPDGSFLLEKVAEATPQCGGRMPLLDDPLTEEQIDALRAWIAGL